MTARNSYAQKGKGVLLTVALAGFLSACGTGGWFGTEEDPPLPGERVSVLTGERSLSADQRIADVQVILPPAVDNPSWPQAGAWPDHAPQHLELSQDLELAWTRSIGSGSSRERRLLTPPIVVGDRVFVLNADLRIIALSAADGEEIWSVDPRPEDEEDGFGGGLAFANGRLYVATGFAQVLAIDPETGDEIWRQPTTGPVRSAPTVADGRVFVVTVDNRLEAFSAEDGALLWSSSGISETASMLGSASPAYSQGVVLAPYSSGELTALKAENGRQVWVDSLAAVRGAESVADLADIRALPVIFRGFAFATSHSGRTAAVDMRTGNRVWDQDFGGIRMPWVAGDFMFLVTNQNELVAMQASDGRVRWVKELARFADPEERQEPLVWAGPVLAGERLYLVNSLGRLMAVSPYTGETLTELELPGPSILMPVVASQTLYVLTDTGTVAAYR